MIIKKKNVAVAFYFSFKKTVPVKLLISQGSQKNFLFFLGPSQNIGRNCGERSRTYVKENARRECASRYGQYLVHCLRCFQWAGEHRPEEKT